MKLPRDVGGDELVRGLRRLGYDVTRQRGDHVYMTTLHGGEHHVSVPLHRPIKVGTLKQVLNAVAAHLGISRDDLIGRLEI
jgi:predicted RNA binding protein YcfA (HicA-like mRNA interferase family)